MNHAPHYRPEIDGLRALAVLAVLAYHLESAATGRPLLAGGYLGVDVFFVISGYLITSLILASVEGDGGFSYARFYERRARRLLPALLLVLLASLPPAWWLLWSEPLVHFGRSLLASLAFGSNFFWLASQQQYAAEDSALQPLLHTWSLGVEEQFYLVFPVFFLAIRRYWPSKVRGLLLGTALLSLAGSEALAAIDSSAAFYLLPSRWWEIAIGAWLATRRTAGPVPGGGLRSLLPGVGLAMIVAAMVVPALHSEYPGLKTLVPVCGVLMMIHWAGPDPATRLLASRPVVAVGLISYSLYLWHYPIYAFGRHWHPQPGPADKTAWVVLSVLLATATWIAVERPFRDRERVRLRAFVVVAGLATLLVAGVCAFWIAGGGTGGRPGYLAAVLQRNQQVFTEQGGRLCHSGGKGDVPVFALSRSCVFRYAGPGRPRTLVLVGDSNAGALSEPLRRLAKANEYDFVQVTENGCPHVAGVGDDHCRQRTAQLRAFVATFPHSTVIYHARVPLLLESVRFDNGEGDREAGYRPVPAAQVERNFADRARALRDTLADLATVSERLVIVYPVPEQGFNIGDRLRAWRPAIRSQSDLPSISTSLAVFRARVRRSDAVLDGVPGTGVARVRPGELFCGEETGRCVVSERGRVYYASDTHLSPLGAGLVVAQVAEQLGLESPERAARPAR